MKRLSLLIVIILTLGLATPNRAAEVIRFTPGDGNFLAVAKDQGHKVALNQTLCFYQKKRQIGCGLVIRLSDKGYIVALDSYDKKAKLGQGEKLEVRKMNRTTAAQSNKLEIVQTPYETEYFYKSTVGGLNVLSPYFRFEQMLTSWLTLGVMPMFVLGQKLGAASLSGAGFFATTSVYPIEPLNQLWGMGGIGGLFATAKGADVEEKVLSAGAFLVGGWRFRFGQKGTLGLATGLQFYLLPGTSAVSSDYSPFQPTVMLDAGFIF